MKIDPATGRISWPELGFSCGPTLTRAQFLRSPLSALRAANVPPGRHFRAQLPIIAQRDTELYVVLHFDGARLASLDLFHSAERFGSAWPAWSEEHEQARRAFQESWLVTELRLAYGDYPWGQVRPHYEPAAGANAISIRYHGPNAWQSVGRTAGRLWGLAAVRS